MGSLEPPLQAVPGFTQCVRGRLLKGSNISNVSSSNDTTPEAERFYTNYLRSLTGQEKVRMALEMTETANQICKQGIAHRHPNYTEEEIHFAFLRIIWGHELFAQVHPSGPFLARNPNGSQFCPDDFLRVLCALSKPDS
jgi:hypothetical protein